MVKQYPHTVIVSTVSASVMGEDGNWEEGSTLNQTYIGRFESNTKNLFIQAHDGTQVVYAGIVYGQFSGIALGASVEVKSGEQTIAKGTVKQFSQGALNSRIWL